MSLEHIKIGRNELCHCGTGLKYKKCCLYKAIAPLSNKIVVSNSTQQKRSFARFKQRISETFGDKATIVEAEHELKMSEVILQLAEELLDHAKTKAHAQKAIMVTCIAWNLAVMHKPKQQKKKLVELLGKIDDLEDQQAIFFLVQAMIQKKNQYYPDVKRIIIEYELTGFKNLHLNVVSTIHKK